jgi:hypothetical protein
MLMNNFKYRIVLRVSNSSWNAEEISSALELKCGFTHSVEKGSDSNYWCSKPLVESELGDETLGRHLHELAEKLDEKRAVFKKLRDDNASCMLLIAAAPEGSIGFRFDPWFCYKMAGINLEVALDIIISRKT